MALCFPLRAGAGLFVPCALFLAGDGEDFLRALAPGEADACGFGVGLFPGLALAFFGRGVGDSSADSEDSVCFFDFRKAARLRASSSVISALTSVARNPPSRIAVIQRLEKRVTGSDRIRAGGSFKRRGDGSADLFRNVPELVPSRLSGAGGCVTAQSSKRARSYRLRGRLFPALSRVRVEGCRSTSRRSKAAGRSGTSRSAEQ